MSDVDSTDLELLRMAERRETFRRTSGADDFDRVAEQLFALERRGLLEIPPNRVLKDSRTASGRYLAIAPQLTPAGRRAVGSEEAPRG